MRHRTSYQDDRTTYRARSEIFIDAKIAKIESLLITMCIIDGRRLKFE